MTIEINVDGVKREYRGDYDQLHNHDWTSYVQDMLDTAQFANDHIIIGSVK